MIQYDTTIWCQDSRVLQFDCRADRPGEKEITTGGLTMWKEIALDLVFVRENGDIEDMFWRQGWIEPLNCILLNEHECWELRGRVTSVNYVCRSDVIELHAMIRPDDVHYHQPLPKPKAKPLMVAASVMRSPIPSGQQKPEWSSAAVSSSS